MAHFIIADTQLAQFWNHLEVVFPEGYVTNLNQKSLINANKNLEKVVSSMTREDILISNGDTVDCHFATYEGEGNNWDLFKKIIGDKKYYLVRGNHDYRLFPYNTRIYKLEHVNLSNKERKRFAQKIGHDKFRWFGELSKSVFNINLPANSGLAGVPSYYHDHLEGKRHIFLDTGPDAVNYWRLWPRLIRWHKVIADPPCSRGLDEEQIRYLEENLTDDNFVYVHAPPFFSYDDAQIDLGDQKKYLKQLNSSFNQGIFIEKNWEFVSALRNHQGNIVVVMSHVEVLKQYLADKKTGLASLSSLEDINEKLDDENYIKFVSTPSLGSINEHCWEVGYLKFEKKFECIKIGDYS